MPLPSPLRGCRTAFIFLTRIPVGGDGYTENDWRWSTAWFPFVGLMIGICLALTWKLLSPLGPWPCAFVVIGLAMMVTGGFHEDGLADTADALGGAYNREKLFVILKDSRVGAFGAMALCVAIGLRASLLAELDAAAPVALVITESLSRLTPIWLMVIMPYVSADEQAKSRQVARARCSQGIPRPACCGQRRILGVGDLSTFKCIARHSWHHLCSICGWRFQRRAGGITATRRVVCGFQMSCSLFYLAGASSSVITTHVLDTDLLPQTAFAMVNLTSRYHVHRAIDEITALAEFLTLHDFTPPALSAALAFDSRIKQITG